MMALKRMWLLVFLLCVGISQEAWGQTQYIPRNYVEFYHPYLLGDGLATPDSSFRRFLDAEHARRYQLTTWGEARQNRPLFVDFSFYLSQPCIENVLDDSALCGMPGEGLNLGTLQEAIFFEPVFKVGMEAYASGKVTRDWTLSGYFSVRTPLLLRETLPLELKGRFLASRRVFTGLMPVDLGFLIGPEIYPVSTGIPAMTVGGFGIFHTSRTAYTRASVLGTTALGLEPFSSFWRLEISEQLMLKRNFLSLQLGGGLHLRPVNVQNYNLLFEEGPPTRNFVDMVVNASLLFQLPHNIKLDLSGQLMPYHTPDENLVRWYRMVGPELGVVAHYRLAIFDLTGGYTFALVPPVPDPQTEYEDTGGPVVPGSGPGHRFSISLGLHI